MNGRIQGLILGMVMLGIGIGATYFAVLPVRGFLGSIRQISRGSGARALLANVMSWLFPLLIGVIVGCLGLMLIAFGGLLSLSTLF